MAIAKPSSPQVFLSNEIFILNESILNQWKDNLESKEEGMKQEDAVHYLQLLRDIQRNRY